MICTFKDYLLSAIMLLDKYKHKSFTLGGVLNHFIIASKVDGKPILGIYLNNNAITSITYYTEEANDVFLLIMAEVYDFMAREHHEDDVE